MPHLDFFTEDTDLLKRFGPRGDPRERRGHLGGSESETSRLARQKRLTLRRIGAEGRIETIFPSLLVRGPEATPQEDLPPGAVPPSGPPGEIPPSIFKPTSGETTQAKAARRAKSKRQFRGQEEADPFSFLSAVGATAGGGGGGGSGGGGGGGRGRGGLGGRISRRT